MPDRGKILLSVSAMILLHLTPIQSDDLTDITASVFGNYSGVIPAAFGDFNADKLTDMFVLSVEVEPPHEVVTVTVLLAQEQKVVGSASSLTPLFHWGTAKQKLKCRVPKGSITSVVPGDFDGDGGMDLLLTLRMGDDDDDEEDEGVVTDGHRLHAVILWGEHSEAKHELLCHEDQPKAWRKTFHLVLEPLVFDYNYDYVADLLVVDGNGTRTVLVFSADRSAAPERIRVESPRSDRLKAQHSNAFLDLNSDGEADVLLTTESGLELYYRVGDTLVFNNHVPWPPGVGGTSSSCPVDKCVGQAVFTDFDLNGLLDLILPVCFDISCQNSSMYLIPVNELGTAKSSWRWQPMSIDLGKLTFLQPDPAESILRLLAPRVGDIDLDGFPDLLMPLYNHTSNAPETHLLLNTPCGAYAACQPFWRQYQLRPSFTQGTGRAIMATFFDLFEDGKLDVLAVEGNNGAGHKMSAYTNTTQDSDAYFIKVIVLSGACYHDCRNKSTSFVPYGTNSGGQLISYRSQRPGPETFDSYQSAGAQLTQTAHFALQLPYTIFGLGMAPNFVDYLWVNISGRTHSWPQIIPNSQLYIIPYPPNQPDSWAAKISIFPSKETIWNNNFCFDITSIVITGLAMVGTCLLTTLIILLLHIRERRQDRHAKLQDTNRFHFDAM